MKKLLLLALMLPFVGCSTVQQAQTDFSNFKKTIEFNSSQPRVYTLAHF